MALDAAQLTLGVGQSGALKATLSAKSAGLVRFESDAPEILQVNGAGELQPLAPGRAIVTAETYNGHAAQCVVTVLSAPTGIALEWDKLTLGVGEKLTLKPSLLSEPGGECAAGLSYKSSKKSCVSVSASGVLKGVRTGSATITVSTHNGHQASLRVTVRKAPGKVSLSAKSMALGLGEMRLLQASLPSGTAGSLRFESSNPAVTSVEPDGRIQALGTGSATISCITYNNKKAKCSVRVYAAPTRVTLSAGELTLGAGEKYTLSAGLPEGSAGSCTFESSDPSVARVDAASGQITAAAPGSAVIRVRSYNGLEDECALRVKAAPTGIRFQESSLRLSAGDRYTLLAPVLTGEGAASGQLKYKSSNTRYLKVSAGGVLTAVKSGKARLTVTTYNGKKATLNVTIKAAPKSISFVEPPESVFVGASFTPEVQFSNSVSASYRLSSSNPAAVGISPDGRSVTAVGGGTAVITATAYNGKKASFELRVPQLPQSIRLEPATLTLGAGDSLRLRAVMPEGQNCALRYASSGEGIATVDEEGCIQAVAEGSATIQVTTQNGLQASCEVRVCRAPSRIELWPNEAVRSLNEGSLQLRLEYGGEGEGGRVTYQSSDEAVATVDANGRVRLVGAGMATIEARSYNGCVASCALTVGEQPGQMQFDAATYVVALGDSIPLRPSFDKGCESYRLSASDSGIATTDGTYVRGLALGRTAVTATSRSGLTARCTLEVAPPPTGIELQPAQAQLTIGRNATLQLQARCLPGGVGSVRYASSNPEIASVDSLTGLVRANAPGNCVITATSYDGLQSAQCALKVGRLLDGVRIGIDPGHQAKADLRNESSSPKGGASKDRVTAGGTGRSTRIKEHVTNLQVGLKLRDALEALGAEVYMTRESADVNISNKQRALMMNELGVDLVLRLHCNSASSSGISGFEIHRRKSCAYSSGVVNASQLLSAEKRAAQAISAEYKKATGFKNRGIKVNNDYTGNNWSTVPCLLVEMGFNSNSKEDRRLNSPEYQAKIVQGLVNGVCVYMGRDLPEQ